MMRVWRLSVWRLSVAYIGPKSRTERPRKTKIGTEVAHVTRDSDTTFKVKRSKVNLQGAGILWRPPAQLVTVAQLVHCKLPWALHHIARADQLSMLRLYSAAGRASVSVKHRHNKWPHVYVNFTVLSLSSSSSFSSLYLAEEEKKKKKNSPHTDIDTYIGYA